MIPDARVRNIISKGPKYRFPSNIDFPKCRREIAASLNDLRNRWCKQENVEPDALKEWKINIFKIIDTCISFYFRNTHLLPPKPKSSFRHPKRGIQDFQMNYAFVPANKAAVKLKKIKTKFLRCTGYPNSIKTPIKQNVLLILVHVRQQNFLKC